MILLILILAFQSLPIIGCPFLALGSKLKHTDCQRGNLVSLEWCASFALISVQYSPFWCASLDIRVDYPELLSKDNRWDKKTFKDKLPPSIHENPFYQRLGRHHVNIRTFSDSILFLAGLKRSWEHGQQWPVIFVGRKDFRNFMYTEDDEDLSFLLREPSLGFRTCYTLYVLINNEPLLLEAEPLNATNPEQLFENTVDSRGSLVREGMLVIGTGSVVGRMKDRKVRLKGSTKPTMKRLSDVPEQQNGTSCHLMISNITPPAWRGHFDNQIKGECDMLKEMKKARDKECEELKAKCEAAMANFDNNPVVNVLRQKIKSLSGEVKEQKASLDRMLEVVESTLRHEIDVVKYDRVKVFMKVVPYVAMEFVHSDEMDMLVGKLVSSVVFYGRCAAFEEVANMKEPFDLAKVKGYRPSYKKEHTKASNDLVTATFPFLSKVVADPSVSAKALLSKMPYILAAVEYSWHSCEEPMQRSHGVKKDFLYKLPLINMYWGALIMTFLASFRSSGSRPLNRPASNASYSASLFVVSNSNLKAYVYSFPSGLISIKPALEPSELEASSVYSFYMTADFASLFVALDFLVSIFLSSAGGISARKLANIWPLTELRPLNSMSCSPSLMAHLAIHPDFSGLARICLMGLSVNIQMG
ncbi:hypothetical protein Tco_0485590 [Tanacetum coccineum]